MAPSAAIKRFTSFMMICCCLFWVQSASAMWRLTSEATVYDYPLLSANVVAQAQTGQTYEIVDSTEKNRWIMVTYNDDQTGESVQGWIKEDILSSPPYSFESSEQQEDLGEGYVLCEALSVRETDNAASKVLLTLNYGTTFRVLQERGSWYNISYQEINGWVNGSYVLLDPPYYTTSKETPAFAYDSQNAKRVALIDAGVKLPIIASLDGYYVISLRGASAFIQK
jgi:uncharacterized protein YgiM (DUF1202 family)